MARLVVIRFDDNAAAERFIDHMDNPMNSSALNQAAMALAHGEVVALHAQPTQYCEHNVPEFQKGNSRPFARSAKYGWWVHKACAKPRRQWANTLSIVLGQSKNLLHTYRKSRKETVTSDGNESNPLT